MFDPLILLYFLLFFVVVVVGQLLYRLFEVRAWIRIKTKKGVMEEVAYLKYNEGEASEVFLSGGNSSLPIGRVIIGTSRDENGYVEILSSNYEDTSTKPVYMSYGYVSPEGYIYKKTGKNGRPKRIGYTAKPSKPNEPSSVGERTWRTLWLVCTLYVYLGKPNTTTDGDEPNSSSNNSNAKKEKIESNRILVFNNDNSSEQPHSQEEEPMAEEQTDENVPSSTLEVMEPESQENSPEEDTLEAKQEGQREENAPDVKQEELQTDEKQEVKQEEPKEEEEEEVKDNPPEDNQDILQEEDTEDNQEEKKKEKKNKGKGKGKKKAKRRLPDAIIQHRGFHQSKNDVLSPESRGGAFALLFERYNKNNYSEYYKNRPYGWMDTALLTSFVYSILYLIGYVLVTYIWRKTFIGLNPVLALEFGAFYFILWALIRQLKIYSIESLDTFQPRLDLFNKTLGVKYMDYAIIVLSLLASAFIGNYYLTLDWAPLIFAIFVGTSINLLSKSANAPWVIKNSLYDNDELEDAEEEPRNPDGDIARTYDWDLDSRISEAKLHGNLTLYFTSATITDIRQINPFFAKLKEHSDKDYIVKMFHYMKEHNAMLARLRYVAYNITKLCDKHGLHELDRIQFILDFVQEPNIKFCMNRDSEAINKYKDYIRYPDETLYDKEGDSNSKALLAAMLFHLMKHNVLYLHSRIQEHAAIGVEFNPEWLKSLGSKLTVEEMTMDYNGKKYIFCETTGDRFRIVDVMKGMQHDDFEERIELPVIVEDLDDANPTDTQETRFYNWDLDSKLGNQLHGSFTLEFDSGEIQKLRELNPFGIYGDNSLSYEERIQKMLDIQRQDDDYQQNVYAIAKYIRESIAKAGLPEIDLVQFALDFAQAPNVTYCVDENSASIGHPQEYMRFPDEVLFDKEGDCDCKSSLTAALFHELGYNVVIMLSEKLSHAAVGIELKEEWLDVIKPENPERVILEYNGKRYLYCETTGDGYKIGHIKENDSIQDFETIVEVPA